ncbi:hypothetical protein GW791_02565 [Candidatus Saccharibacteria bacterium]|nr:hypothetical protein [Candidatus Saccharibacteria bacterium]
MSKLHKHQDGFTVLELVIVVVVIIIFAIIAFSFSN